MARQSIDYERFNPFRRPDWRMDRVLQMLDREQPGRSLRRDDSHIRDLRAFVLQYRRGNDVMRNQLAYEQPGIYWAYQIYDGRADAARKKAIMVEARLLAAQDDHAIAADLHTIPDVSCWYERLFYNVRDRLHAHDWILDEVLMPSIEMALAAVEVAPLAAGAVRSMPRLPLAEPFFDPTLKFFAYFGGPVILDFVLSGFRRGLRAHSADDAGQWFDNQMMGRTRQRSAMAMQTFEVNRYNVMELFETHLQLVALEKTSDSLEAKKDQAHRIISAMMGEMPWTVGRAGEQSVHGTALDPYDNKAAELRDDELLLLASGQRPVTVEGVNELTLPAPRLKEPKEEKYAATNAE